MNEEEAKQAMKELLKDVRQQASWWAYIEVCEDFDFYNIPINAQV